MDRLADESEIQWMPLLYGVAAGLSSLIVVQMLVWIFHYRGGFAWQDVPALQFNWHPLLMVISLIILYGHGNFQINRLVVLMQFSSCFNK